MSKWEICQPVGGPSFPELGYTRSDSWEPVPGDGETQFETADEAYAMIDELQATGDWYTLAAREVGADYVDIVVQHEPEEEEDQS